MATLFVTTRIDGDIVRIKQGKVEVSIPVAAWTEWVDEIDLLIRQRQGDQPPR